MTLPAKLNDIDAKIQDKLNEIELRFKADTAVIDDLKAKRDELKAERDNLKAKRDDLKAKLDDLKAEVDAFVIVPTPLPDAKSKADIVRALIRRVKLELTLLDVLDNPALICRIANEANLTPSLCRAYLKNNWNKA